MHLEQSIHSADSLTISIVRGETSTWTVFKVEVEGAMLEFTAFGELPLAVEVFDDTAIPDLVDFLSDQGALLDAAKAGRRSAERVCDGLRSDIGRMSDEQTAIQGRLKFAQNRESEVTEENFSIQGQLADAQGEARDREATIENLEQEAHAFRSTIDELRAELRTVNAAYESAQERGLI